MATENSLRAVVRAVAGSTMRKYRGTTRALESFELGGIVVSAKK